MNTEQAVTKLEPSSYKEGSPSEEQIAEFIEALEELADNFLQRTKGSTKKAITSTIAIRSVAVFGTAPAMMGIASSFGTASTGTAISALSGAAFNSAALAWLGGSVALGGAVVSAATLGTGVLAYFGSKKVGAFFLHQRKIAELPMDEKRIANDIVSLIERLKTDLISDTQLVYICQNDLKPILKKIDMLTAERFINWKNNDIKKLGQSVLKLYDFKKTDDETIF